MLFDYMLGGKRIGDMMATKPAAHLTDARMYEIADRLARSGHYHGTAEIELELKRQGYLKGRSLLNDSNVWQDLDRLCDEARGMLASRNG
jgi:hypothetical protein